MKHNEEIHDEIGDNHISSCATNPLREDAFDITDDEKIESIKKMSKISFLHLGWI
jgi:GTP cyclohydrolase I